MSRAGVGIDVEDLQLFLHIGLRRRSNYQDHLTRRCSLYHRPVGLLYECCITILLKVYR